MKFSFIIPAYNEGKLIGRCIESIKNQTGKADEIIVVDNNSLDLTPKIAERLGCRVVKEEKQGISEARNKGAGIASGDIFCFVDADGVVGNNWLRYCKNIFLKDKNVNAVVGLNIFTNKSFFKSIYYNIFTIFAYTGLLIIKFFFKRTYLAGNNFAIRKNAFRTVGGFKSFIGEDFWFSREYWKKFHRKEAFEPRMVIRYSSRAFDNRGLLKTVLIWIFGGIFKANQKNYSYRNKEFHFLKSKH